MFVSWQDGLRWTRSWDRWQEIMWKERQRRKSGRLF